MTLENMRNLPRVVISAAHKSSGKTVFSVGLSAALSNRGLIVQPFKKGPDFIDPGWLSTASGKECRNLDKHLIGWDNIESVFKRHSVKADISIIEGNKGLYDSVDVYGEGSTANLARRLKAPVILVLDCGKITRGVAPLLIGYKNFEPDINIAGVILNQVSSRRHEQKLRSVISEYCGIEVLGAIKKSDDMKALERHLGLVPIKEEMGAYPTISSMAREIAESVDLERIIEIANRAPKLECSGILEPEYPEPDIKIGVIKDRAFTFYYPENLEALRVAGAKLISINSIKDAALPDGIDALYIGGGFPEAFLDKLEANESLRNDIKLAVENGLPVHAECGGLIYLAKSLAWNGKSARMAGALDCDIVIRKKPVGHGYISLKATGESPWLKSSVNIPAHEFHYGDVVNSSHKKFAFEILRGNGIDGQNDGIVYKNVTASFAHLHELGCNGWARDFVAFSREFGFSRKWARINLAPNESGKAENNLKGGF